MKFKTIVIILLLILILVGLIVGIVKEESNNSTENFKTMLQSNSDFSSKTEQTTENKTTVKQNSEVESALVEKVEPHATYYLEEIYVENNQYVEKGANILKYTNGTYLTAPYDCCITELNLPQTGGKILNSHYVQISSNNALAVTVNVDEANINNINVGQEATVTISTLEKEFTGYVTKVGSTASNGKFKVTVEFENDGNVKLGMTASVEIVI